MKKFKSGLKVLKYKHLNNIKNEKNTATITVFFFFFFFSLFFSQE